MAYVTSRVLAGAVVAEAASGDFWSIPVVSNLNIVDVTGCGNAFCGALLSARQASETAMEAGLWGTAAASFMAECPAVPVCSPKELHTAAFDRVAELRKATTLLKPSQT